MKRDLEFAGGFFALLVLALVTATGAETLTARVVGVTDGDTITVLISGRQQAVVRLAGIDAPEHEQAFGSASEQNLSALISEKNVNLDCGDEESYGRLAGCGKTNVSQSII